MKILRYVALQRPLTANGIEVAGIRYQSPALQSLRGDDEITVSIKLDPLGIANIQAWNANSSDWLEVPFEKFERLASQREIEELAYGLYEGSRRMDGGALRLASSFVPRDCLPSASLAGNALRGHVSREGLPARSIIGQFFGCILRWFNINVLDCLINLGTNR